jgi:hypothetical protein
VDEHVAAGRVYVGARNQAVRERVHMEHELRTLHARMDAVYMNKLDGKIPEEFWQRKQADWQAEEFRIKSRIAGQEGTECEARLLDVRRILELAHNAHSLYLTRKPAEQAELLKKVLLNCSIDAVRI